MSVRELIKNQKYQIEVVKKYIGNKKDRHYEVFYGTKKQAILRENEIKLQLKNHTYVDKNKITLQDLMKQFVEAKKDDWAPKTYVTNLKRIYVINEKIGYVHLQDLNARILDDFYRYLRNIKKVEKKGKEQLEERKYSNKTIQHFYGLINNALNKAVIWDYISVNVNQKIEKPKVRKKQVECYSPEEVEKLIEVLQNEPLKYQAIIYLALDSGCRRGEITRINLGRYRLKKLYY